MTMFVRNLLQIFFEYYAIFKGLIYFYPPLEESETCSFLCFQGNLKWINCLNSVKFQESFGDDSWKKW